MSIKLINIAFCIKIFTYFVLLKKFRIIKFKILKIASRII